MSPSWRAVSSLPASSLWVHPTFPHKLPLHPFLSLGAHRWLTDRPLSICSLLNLWSRCLVSLAQHLILGSTYDNVYHIKRCSRKELLGGYMNKSPWTTTSLPNSALQWDFWVSHVHRLTSEGTFHLLPSFDIFGLSPWKLPKFREQEMDMESSRILMKESKCRSSLLWELSWYSNVLGWGGRVSCDSIFLPIAVGRNSLCGRNSPGRVGMNVGSRVRNHTKSLTRAWEPETPFLQHLFRQSAKGLTQMCRFITTMPFLLVPRTTALLSGS